MRELKSNQLVRVVDGKVREVAQFAPARVEPTATRTIQTRVSSSRGTTIGSVQARGDKRGELLFGAGRQARLARIAAGAPGASEEVPQRLTKAQRKRARQAAAARRDAARRIYGDDGFFWYQGMMVTQEEYELLMESER